MNMHFVQLNKRYLDEFRKGSVVVFPQDLLVVVPKPTEHRYKNTIVQENDTAVFLGYVIDNKGDRRQAANGFCVTVFFLYEQQKWCYPCMLNSEIKQYVKVL